MAKVVIENLYKIYKGDKGEEKIAVDNANFVIEDKEFMVLVGPSGCGKTTTLRMIAGLEEISKGNVYIDGKIINDIPPKDRDIAMVFQNYALYPHMTVYKNMAFGLYLRKVDKKEIHQRVMNAAKILGLTEPDNLLERKPKALSGGQRQRVALGRAIVRNPKAFLFDEPLSNLDAKMRVEMRTEISKLHNRLSSTMIYVTHDQVEAMTMADRIVVMKNGIIQQIDEPLTIYNQPANLFVASFIGSPPTNFFYGRIQQDKKHLLFQELSSDDPSSAKVLNSIAIPHQLSQKLEPYLDKPIIMGIRPEHLKDASDPGAEDPSHLIKAKLEVKEPLGAETCLYLHSGRNSFIARIMESRIKAEINSEMSLSLDPDKLHFFDKITGDTIV